MRFSVSSSDLQKELQKMNGAIANNPVMPILEDFLFQVRGNMMHITASDLENTISTDIEVRSDEDGDIAVPGKILLETLKSLPTQPLTFNVDPEQMSIEITSSYGKYRLSGENSEDFPELPEVPTENSITVDGHALLDAVTATLFATSNDELRMAMTGVLIEIDNDKLTAVATDAHKLVRYSFHGLGSNVVNAFILPKKSVALLKNTLGEEPEVKVSFTQSNAFFEIGKVRLICRIISQKYPDYNAVIPTNNPNVMTAQRQDLLNSIKRISIYSNKTTNQIILSLTDNSLTLSAQDLDFANEATEIMACEYDDEPMVIGFNSKFLIEMLTALESDEIELRLSKPNKAGILVPTQAPDNHEILMLVMPVMMNNY